MNVISFFSLLICLSFQVLFLSRLIFHWMKDLLDVLHLIRKERCWRSDVMMVEW